MKTILFAAALAAVLATGCNKGKAKVEVNCKENAAGDAECTVTHLDGTMKAKMCWDIIITCENGQKVTGSACETVAKAEKKTTTILRKDYKNLDQCDRMKSSEVANMKVTKAK